MQQLIRSGLPGPVATSIYLQAITLLTIGSMWRSTNLKDMNLDVYKDTGVALLLMNDRAV
ncbi:MAG: hypothetical protein HOM16_01230 [Woeseia sp.]|nr:hypothetical protein [Woeseia sp.]